MGGAFINTLADMCVLLSCRILYGDAFPLFSRLHLPHFLGSAAEQVLLLENIATSVKLGPDQLPTVYKLLTDAVRRFLLLTLSSHENI